MSNAAARALERARRMTIRRFASAADADREDHAYWQQIPEAERALEAWRLSQELWRLKGGPPHESGLCRSVRAFAGADVRFMIVGAYALAVHGRPRATGDLDIWIDATPENAPRVMQALGAFGAPLGEIREADFARPGVVYQIGVPPGRIDILTELTGLAFEQAWPNRIRRPFGELEVDFIDRTSFLHNKRATGRLKDLSDIEGLD